jgi:hypothetical protein
MDSRDNTLIRSTACEICGARLLWTQAAWPEAPTSSQPSPRAAYRCMNGHLIDPAATPQCPSCGVHDTARAESPTRFTCQRCGAAFSVPR